MATTRPATDMLAESLVSWAAHALASGPARNTVRVVEGVRMVRERRCPAGVAARAVISREGCSPRSGFDVSNGAGCAAGGGAVTGETVAHVNHSARPHGHGA